LILGVAGRLWAQSKPANFDFNVWLTASQSVLDGNNPYELNQFNYAPSWLAILVGLRFFSTGVDEFRLYIAVFLLLTDLAIALILMKKGYSLAALLFFVSPIGIAISGQHQQIDSLAILVALIAVLIAAGRMSGSVNARDWALVGLLGLSLSIKHVFLLFPVWLFLRQGSIKKRLLYLIGPYVVFALALAFPFLTATDVVFTSMVRYGGANNSPVLYFLLPDQAMSWIISQDLTKVAFAVALVIVGYLFRRLPLFELALLYTVSALLFSWSVVNQYLAIPLAGVSVWMNLGFAVWMLLGSVYLLGDPLTLNFPILNQVHPHLFQDFNVVSQDLFPWLAFGWLLLAYRLRKTVLLQDQIGQAGRPAIDSSELKMN